MLKIGLVSTYKEGGLLAGAALSALRACDTVGVFNGPVAGLGKPEGLNIAFSARVHIESGEWESDAAKRTYALRWAQQLADLDPFWVLWVDGDEVLLWGEYLHDYCRVAAYQGEEVAGLALRIVEFDGSCAKTYGKLVRGDLIDCYLHSSLKVRMRDGTTVTLPNIPICAAGGVPVGHADGRKVTVDDLAELRPPLAGEPHLLHRAAWRDPERGVRRLHEVEKDGLEPTAGELLDLDARFKSSIGSKETL